MQTGRGSGLIGGMIRQVLLMLMLLGPVGYAPVVQAQTAETAPDFTEWERTATRADSVIADDRTTELGLEQLRAQLVDWRARFLAMQNTDQPRAATLRAQIDALGPLPVDGGAQEAPEIAKRRTELGAILARLLAPGLAAEEAYRRADGLIRDVDRVMRDRQADALMQLWPAPVNPANWPSALSALSQTTMELAGEVREGWATESQRDQLRGNLPVILAYLIFAIVLLNKGRGWMERLAWKLSENASARGRKVYALLVSLGQVVLPVLGVVLLVQALKLTGMIGPVGDRVLGVLPTAGFAIFGARWLGMQIFPKGAATDALLKLSPERRVEGRFHAAMLGLVMALQILRQAAVSPVDNIEAANAVLSFPLLVIAGVMVFRVGRLLRLHVENDDLPGEATNFRNRLIGLIGRGTALVGIGGPALAAIGYVAAATAILYPTVQTLAVIALLIVLQRAAGDVQAALTKTEDQVQNGLTPVLVGFGLTVLSLPLVAIIWGARASDLAEVWSKFGEGVSLGGARISPGDVVTFAVLFGIGYGLTRLFQGALRSSILPKTKLDQGGQNAVVSGTGYVGIFLAGLIAINSAGIDLSGLAIVAGALSVGIGFGLQNIVSNFVSGIILLIERPVSEGDWIEVGGVMGTVRAISVRSTRIETFDRTDVIVPNLDLVSGMVTNWTRFNLTGRLVLNVGVAYGSDTQLVSSILGEIAEAQPLVVLNPKPAVHFVSFGADALNFEIRMILRDVNFISDVRTAINHEIAKRFEQKGIVFPFAQRDIWIRNPEALAIVANPAQIGLVPMHLDAPPPALATPAPATPAPATPAPATPARATPAPATPEPPSSEGTPRK